MTTPSASRRRHPSAVRIPGITILRKGTAGPLLRRLREENDAAVRAQGRMPLRAVDDDDEDEKHP